MSEEIIPSDNEIIKIHDLIRCIWQNSKNLNRIWKLMHISNMYYYFRDVGEGTLTIINKEQFHSYLESGYYAIIQMNEEGTTT